MCGLLRASALYRKSYLSIPRNETARPRSQYRNQTFTCILDFHRSFIFCVIAATREYWMIYRGPGCLAVVWFDFSPPPSLPPLLSAQVLSFSVFLCVAGRVIGGRGRGEGLCEEPNHQIIRPRETLVLYNSLNTRWKPPVSFLIRYLLMHWIILEVQCASQILLWINSIIWQTFSKTKSIYIVHLLDQHMYVHINENACEL
jgi:hypothetical protein